VQWRALAIVLAVLTGAFALIDLVQQFSLGDAKRTTLSREKIACRDNMLGLRKREAGYIAIDRAARKLMADTADKSIENGFGPFLSTMFADNEVIADTDYQHALLGLIKAVADYRAGAATVEQVGAQVDDVLVQGQKAAERTKTLIDAALPQSC
jgi:hypothetical protein